MEQNTTNKLCPKCGEKLPSDAQFCVNCGIQIESFSAGTEKLPDMQENLNVFQKQKKKIGIGVAILAVIVVTIFAVNAIRVSELKKELKRDWMDIEGKQGAYIEKILDFSDDEVEYRLETGYSWLDTTLGTYKYKVVSGNKIKINRFGDKYETYKIEFNEDKTSMKVTPAITSSDDNEYWYNFD